MENFIDKLAEKLNAGEMIRANRAADTEQMERLQSRIREYERCLGQMTLLNRELQETVKKINADKTQEMETLAAMEKAVEVLQQAVNQQHKSVDGLKHSLEEGSVRTNDYVHKENVKVYRNVQAVIVEENAKQKGYFDELRQQFEELKQEVTAPRPTPGIQKGILGVAITAMLLAAASVAFQVLVYLQII